MQTPPPQPQVPDPYAVAKAQTGSNVDTAVANSYLGNANEVSPLGTVTYDKTGTEMVDGREIPRFTRTTTLSPEQQDLYNQQTQLGGGLNQLAIDQTGRLSSTLNTPFNLAGLPAADNSIGQYNPSLRTTFDPGGTINQNAPTAFNDTANRVQGDVGANDFSADRQRVEDAIYSRLTPQLERDRATLETKLANQGVASGTEAWNREIDAHNRSATDARMQAILAGGGEQSRMFGLDLSKGQFHNLAQGQDYEQQQGRGLFGLGATAQNNAAQAQQYGQNRDAASFGNAADQQMFANREAIARFGNTARERALQERLTTRNQPINEIAALMSGGQVTMPQFAQFRPGNVDGTPLGQYVYNSAGLANDQWRTQANMAGQSNAGLFGLGSSGIGALGYMGGMGKLGFLASDRKLKRDLKRVGEHDGIPTYHFRYLWDRDDEAPRFGVMADEVEAIMPEAVAQVGNYKAVNYSMIGL